ARSQFDEAAAVENGRRARGKFQGLIAVGQRLVELLAQLGPRPAARVQRPGQQGLARLLPRREPSVELIDRVPVETGGLEGGADGVAMIAVIGERLAGG